MSTAIHDTDRRIIDRYTDQPAGLPAELRHRIEAMTGAEPVLLYAFADIDDRYMLASAWVVLTRSHVVVVSPDGRFMAGDTVPSTSAAEGAGIRLIERWHVTAVHDSRGLSASTLTLTAARNEPPLLVVRYTNRQRRAFERIRFVLEEGIEGRDVPCGDPDLEYAAAIARPIRDTQALVAGRPTSVLLRLLGYMRPYRKELAFGMTAAALITAVSIAPPWIAGRLIDRVVGPAQAGTLDVGRASTIAWLAVAALAMVHVIRQAAALARLRLMSVVGEWVVRDLRSELYAHLQRLSLSFFARKKTGGLITRVTSDTDRIWEFLAFGIIDASLSIVMLIGLSVVLLSLDWRLGLVMTVPAPVFCWLIYRHGEKINPLFLRTWRKWSRVTDVLSDTIPGVRVVKAFNQEQREVDRFVEHNDDVTDEANNVHRMWTTFWPVIMLAVHGTTVMVWALAVPRLLGEGATLSTGTFVSFLLYATMFIAPIDVIGQMARTMHRATSSAHRVFEVLDTEPDVRDIQNAIRLEPVEGRVTFDNVSFSYDGVRQVVRGVSFDVRPGELIGLVGPSGGGKSTLVNLVARFWDVSGGVVRIDGIDVRELDGGHLRRQIGIVLQDPYLFHATVLENISYGLPGASPVDVIAAAQSANAHDFICRLPFGYETVVGERGQTLSGGERQRISIARAILNDPRILILDEATSAVDTETEREIQEALDRLIAGRTVFAIAHRLSTLRRASRLFVIVDGRLAECGTHRELMQVPDGRYRRLHEMQLSMQ
ncbi:MAG TPA: ABC transporter ATP-binding protein [Longimicrobiales bacterium]|nr:ABC transporter ATP-binding protein [Longimicrobiales bacterium]